INDIDVNDLRHKEIPYFRRTLGVVFQDFRLLPNKTVQENVSFAMEIVGASNKEIRRNVPLVLSQVGLSSKAKMYPHQLSGGEQQRVAIARAIVNNPVVLIADEPTGNLDPDTALEIMAIMDEINKRGTTVVMATHAEKIVNDMKKRVIMVEKGIITRDENEGGYGYVQSN
ncbi:MAG: ATP-binding cassette domain-containing protein, partial [Clostridia bacterium]|nr:ATP-binding cassette domain-containing protein [Clostridia bacterium]